MKSLPVPFPPGGQLRLSAQVVAVPSTPTDVPCSRQTLVCLTALLQCLCRETLSGDTMYLAVTQARDLAVENGVSADEFDRVAKLVLQERRRGLSPLAGMF